MSWWSELWRDRRLDRIEEKLDTLIRKEIQSMSLGQEILDKVTAQTTLVESVKALVEGFVQSGTISPEQRDAIFASLAGNTAGLEAAIAAGTEFQP